MKNYCTVTLLLLGFFYSLTAIGQTKKPVSQANIKQKVGPLRTKDYPYYILVRRTSGGPEYKSFYTLPDYYSGKQGDFTGNTILLDIRTGKEVSWWTSGGDNYYLSSYNLLVNHFDANFQRIIKFDTTGLYKGEFLIESSENTPVLGRQQLTLSTDWKKGICQFNNDLWTWDLDFNKGIFSNPTQVTSNGVMGSGEIYFKGDNVIVDVGASSTNGRYIVNISTGKYTNIAYGDWSVFNNKFIHDLFYSDIRGLQNADASRGYFSLKSQKFLKHEKYNQHYMWLDNRNTKALHAKLTKIPTPYENGRVELVLKDIAKGTEKTINTPFFSKVYAREIMTNLDYHTMYVFPVSPSYNKIYYNYQEPLAMRQTDKGTTSYLGVIDCENSTEKVFDVSIQPNKMQSVQNLALAANLFSWTDDNHLIYNATLESKINGIEVTEETQGAYILDIETGKSKRLTTYFIEPEGNIFGQIKKVEALKVYPLKGTDWVVFCANNYIFKCKKDGSELSQIVKFPGVYAFESTFLSEHMEIP